MVGVALGKESGVGVGVAGPSGVPPGSRVPPGSGVFPVSGVPVGVSPPVGSPGVGSVPWGTVSGVGAESSWAPSPLPAAPCAIACMGMSKNCMASSRARMEISRCFFIICIRLQAGAPNRLPAVIFFLIFIIASAPFSRKGLHKTLKIIHKRL